MNRTSIIDKIIETEGGYVNDPTDSGGETNFGITVKVARENGYNGEMFHMPRFIAFDIYQQKYWDTIRADTLPIEVASEVVDTAVNMGVSRASRFLQRSLNLLTSHNLKVDGAIGNATLNALNTYMRERGDTVTLVKMLNSLQGSFYIELAERREKDRKYIYGWFKNRV